MFEKIHDFIKELYPGQDIIPLHEPRFLGKEKEFINKCIDSTFVSTLGPYIGAFEEKITKLTGAKYCVATSNGTAALHMSLLVSGVEPQSLVITQSSTFVATANAIHYCGADPVFIDCDRDNLSLSPKKLQEWLAAETEIKAGKCYHKQSGKLISACMPMHVFGIPAKMKELMAICREFNLPVVEDAAEALGSRIGDKHCGTFGLTGAFSFNGNKIITGGGGGAIVTNDKEIASKAKHLTTTAKVRHIFQFVHDEVGYNYRMPNLNAALLCAQLEQLPTFMENKRETYHRYLEFFKDSDIEFLTHPEGTTPNCWLNAILFSEPNQASDFLKWTNERKILTRPLWKPMHLLPMYQNCMKGPLPNTEFFYERVVNLPSSVRKA